MEIRRSRRLATFERAQVMTAERFAFNVVAAVRFAGMLESDAVRRALDAMQARHALLRARVSGAGSGRRWELSELPPIPLRCRGRRGDEDWEREVEAELGASPDLSVESAARCVLLQGDGAGELVLSIHHAIVDAVSVLLLTREVLAHCAGEPLSGSTEESLPAGADELFPPAYRVPRRWPASARFLAGQMADEVSYGWRTRGRRRPPGSGPVACRVLSTALSAAESTSLVRAGRKHRVGLSSALSAALLLAVVGRRYGGRAGAYRYFTFPLLRPYLRPPVPDEVVAGYLTTLRQTVAIEPTEGLWALAARIHRQVDRAAKRGDRFLAAAWSAASMKLLLGQRRLRMGTTALNYAGATTLEVGAGATFSVEGFHAFVTNLAVGPEYTAQARVFRGRLWLDVVYLDVDMDRDEAQAIARDACDILVAAGQRESPESP